MPKVSVILSAYNAEKYIPAAVESILSQTFRDIEFFIVNDASNDGTGKIIESFTDSRIKYVKNTVNLGVAVSVNNCMDRAKGEYIARMDADDISLPRRLERQADFLDKNCSVGICGAWIKTFGPGKNYTDRFPVSPEEIKFKMLIENPLAQPAIMIRKSMFDKYSLRYIPEYFPSEDYELWSRAVRHFEAANIPEVLLNYRIHPENASSTKREKQLKDTDAIKISQLKFLAEDINEDEAEVFINLVKKNNGSGREFIDTSLSVLLKIKKANEKKHIYDDRYIMPFIASCWSYACKTDINYGFKTYRKGINELNLKKGIIDEAAQIYKTLKFRMKN